MLGDLRDVLGRLRSSLPKRWFSDEAPVLDSILTGIATPWCWLYQVIQYTILQTRISTACDIWLDLIAIDYLGAAFRRKSDEPDDAYRGRIKSALMRSAATRPAICAELTYLTGAPPVIFEPRHPLDTGAYGTVAGPRRLYNCAAVYGARGGWGSMQLPYQFFVTAKRPPTPGMAAVAGYNTSAGGYDGGNVSYVDLSLLPTRVSDSDIQNAVRALLPVNATAWLRIV